MHQGACFSHDRIGIRSIDRAGAVVRLPLRVFA